jgi:acetolactate synthase-1/2/3 large subunit
VKAGELGKRALSMLEIGNPSLDWVALAKAQGVESARATDLDGLARDLTAAIKQRGPKLIEVALA